MIPKGWRRVFSSLHLPTAEIHLQALRQEQVDCLLANEQTVSLGGEIPIGDAHVQLWVPPEQEKTALALIAALREGETEEIEAPCPACGVAVPAQMALCWQCGADQEGVGYAEQREARRPRTGYWTSPVGRWVLLLSAAALAIGLGATLIDRAARGDPLFRSPGEAAQP